MRTFNEFTHGIWQYPEIVSAFSSKALDVFSNAFSELGHDPSRALNVSFNPAITDSFANNGVDVSYLGENDDQYDTVIAVDEAFTYADSEQSQYQNIRNAIGRVAPGGMIFISTRDYRNHPQHKRYLGDSAQLTLDGSGMAVIEINTPTSDKQQWNQSLHVITNDECEKIDVGSRRTLYFKQIAKYCHDMNCQQFGVLKDKFWNRPWSRSVEHIAWARF